MTIAITGATGQLGRLVINTLKTKNAPGGIVALARNIDKDELGHQCNVCPRRLVAEAVDTLVDGPNYWATS